MTVERKEIEDRPSQVTRSERPKRVPIHGTRDILSVTGLERGWHYLWVNDEGGNIDRHLGARFYFVEHDVTVGDRKINAASQIGGRISLAVGNGVTAFLMRCTDEDYTEEMSLLHGEIDERERSMKDALNSKADGRYGQVDIKSNQPLANQARGLSVRQK